MSNRYSKKIKPKNTKKTLVRLLKYLSKFKFKIALITIIVVISNIASLYSTKLIGVAIDDYIVNNDLNGLIKILLFMAMLYILVSFFNWLQSILSVYISENVIFEIRKEAFSKIQKLPLKFFDSNSNGEIMSIMINSIDNIGTGINQNLFQIISTIISLITIFYFMFSINWVLTLINILMLPILYFLTYLITKYSKIYFKRQQEKLAKLNGKIEEVISFQKAVKIFTKEKDEIEEFKKINSKLKKDSIIAQSISNYLGPTIISLNWLNYAILSGMGGIFVIYKIIKIGDVASFLLYSKKFARPFNDLSSLYNSIVSAIASAEKVFEILDEEEEEQDIEGAIDIENLKGDISFEKVYFGYDSQEVLHGISFENNKGEVIALVGPTGAGKTTIINLLTRFYDISSGEIYIDRNKIKNIKKDSLRKNIGIVLQDTYLFSGTIMDNIKYGNLEATEEEVIEACKKANAHKFIEKLPDGYNTYLKEDIQTLSQGQKQMLSIARTILSNPNILILDEATSNIDTRTEIEIQEAMQNLMKNRTSFVIAHRLSTIRNANKILVIENGNIIENGTHEELIKSKGFYYNLYRTQFLNIV